MPIDDPAKRKERREVLMPLTRDASAFERKWAYNGLAVVLREEGDFNGSMAMTRKALAIDPQMIPALGNMSTAHELLGHDQLFVDTAQRQYDQPVTKDYDARIVEANNCLSRTRRGNITRSLADLQWALACFERVGTFSESSSSAKWSLAQLRHDVWAMAAIRYESPDKVEAESVNASRDLARAMLVGDRAALSTALERSRTADRALLARDTSNYYGAVLPAGVWPTEADALSMLGRHAEAAALIARTPRDCYDCLRVRGVVAARMGARGEAQRWFAEAARQGPRLAPAFLGWGRLLLDNRRLPAAEVKLREAARLAPTWPDPLKYWGDLLAAQGKPREARAKYDAALRLAPDWAELRQARAKVAAR